MKKKEIKKLTKDQMKENVEKLKKDLFMSLIHISDPTRPKCNS